MGASTSTATDPTSATNLANAGAGIVTSAALGPAGIALALGGTALSFIQASKQMKLQREAEQSAAKALEEAKRQININPFAALGIQKEPYELEREALLAQGAQAIQAGQEADRGAAATAGRIQMAQNEAQAGQRTAMGKEMFDLNKLTADEQTNIKNALAGVALEETKGYQKQAAEAAKERAKAIQQAYQSGATAIKGAVEELPTIIARGDRMSGAQKDMAKMGLPSVTPPSQTLLPGALHPLSLGATTPESNYVMQNQGQYKAFSSPFLQQMNPFYF